MSDETCQQRIVSHRNGRETDIGLLSEAIDAETDLSAPTMDDERVSAWESLGVDVTPAGTVDEESDDVDDIDTSIMSESAREVLDNYALSVEMVRTVKVLISTGGPADYLTAEVERGRYGLERTTDVSYHFADWFDHAEMRLEDSSPLVGWFDEILETMVSEED